MGDVPIRLDDDDLKSLDLLVKRQAFRSRNEAIRKMIKTMLLESISEDDEVDDLVKFLACKGITNIAVLPANEIVG